MAITLKKSATAPDLSSKDNFSPTVIIPLNKDSCVLLPHNLEEWLQSGVDREIIDLNVRSINGVAVVKFLNIASIPGYNFKWGSVIHFGGWICGDTIMKPDRPRETKKKVHKYEMPVGENPKPTKLILPEHLWQEIAVKYGITKPVDMDGWTWVVENPQIPVVVCESVKKAGCVISQTRTPAIALNGHNMGYEAEGDVRFTEFLHPDRQIIICFDEDVDDITAKQVSSSIRNIGFRLNPKTAKGEKKATVKAKLNICHWVLPEKGIDDIWLRYGKEAVQTILDNASSWATWADMSYSKLGVKPDVTFNSAKWIPSEIPEEAKLIGLIGGKGSGKSWYQERLAEAAKAKKLPIIMITHRILLSKANAKRLELTFIADVDGKVIETTDLALVIDSLAKVNPDKFAGGSIFIDEVVQVLEHFLIGETCAYKRQDILKTLTRLAKTVIETNGKFIIADADLNGATLRFFSGLLGEEKPYLIQNTYCENNYTCYVSNGYLIHTPRGQIIKSPADIVSSALALAKEGKRILICTSGQKENSTFGSISLEALFLYLGVSSVIRVDSDTVRETGHPAFNAVSKINEICDAYQIIIVTSVAGTGVSIENQKPFDLVCGIFTGVGSPDSARQFLIRVRDKSVPRLIYCADKGTDKTLLSLGYSSNSVNKRLDELEEFQQSILTEHDSQWSQEYPEIRHCNTAREYFNSNIANKNQQHHGFKNYVTQGLKDENVKVINITESCEIYPYHESLSPSAVYTLCKGLKEENILEYRTKILEQERIEKEEYEKLKAADELTQANRLLLEATVLSNKYGGIELTEELVELDNGDDKYYKQIRLHYASTVGYESLKNIQALVSNNQLNKGDGEIIQHDFIARNKLLAQTEFIRATEIIDLIDSDHVFSKVDDPSVDLYNDMVEQIPNINLICEEDIKINNFKSGEFNFKLLKTIGELIGANSDMIGKKTVNKELVRQYKLSFEDSIRQEIFELWQAKDAVIEQKWFARKQEWEIKQLVGQLNAHISLSDFDRLKQLELFDTAWERVYTNDRIKIINRVNNFKLPKNEKTLIDANNLTSVVEAFSIISNWDIVSLDCETFGNDTKNKEGLHKFKAQLRLMQLSNGHTTYTFDFGSRNADSRVAAIATVEPLLQSLVADKGKTLVGHNLNFDLGIISSHFALEINCEVSDTLLGIQIFLGIYNGRNAWEGGFGLKALAKKFLGIDIDKTEQKSDWGAALTKSQIDYAADDPHTTYWVWRRLLELYQNPTKFGFGKLAKWDMMSAWQLECACLVPLAEMEQIGLPISLETLHNLDELVQKGLQDTLNAWNNLDTGVNKPSQVQKLITYLNEKYNLNLSKGDKKTLSDYKEHPEVALRFTHSGLLQYQARLKKLIKSAEETTRAKTFYSVLSGTGRTSSGGGNFDDIVNIQSIPAKVDDSLKELKLPSIRSAFKPEVGKALIISDLAASHARIACDFAQDKLGMEVQNNDVDAHSLFAIKIAQCVPEQIRLKSLPEKFLSISVTIADVNLLGEFKNSGKTHRICKQLRDVSKNIYYGKLNGASWKRIQAEARGQLKISVSESEAKAISDVFEELYPELTAYCKSVAVKLEDETNQLWIDGKLFGISEIAETNQRLLFWLKQKDDGVEVPYTNCVASQWSRTEATAMKKALVLCFKLFRKHPEWCAKVVNIVHDELNVECAETFAQPVAKVVAWVMARCFQSELKNGVLHGCANFKSEKDVTSLIVKTWADK